MSHPVREARVETIKDALRAYQGVKPAAARSQSSASPATSVMPQIDTSLFDRIMELSGEKDDLAFRQALVSAMQDANLQLIPLQAEEQNYRNLIQSLRSIDTRARAARPEELALLTAQMNSVVEEAIKTTDEVNQIYRTFSENLNPSTALFSTTATPVSRVERAYSFQQMALIGLLLLVFTVPLATVAAVLHYHVTRSAEQDELELIATPGLDEHRATDRRVEAAS